MAVFAGIVGIAQQFSPSCFHHASTGRRNDFPVARPSSLHPRPEPGLLAMLGLQARGIDVMRLDRSEILDPSGEIGTGCQVLGGIAIALLPPRGQREIDHPPQRHRRGERMLLGQCFGRWCQEFVVIAVNLVVPVDQQSTSSCRSISSQPRRAGRSAIVRRGQAMASSKRRPRPQEGRGAPRHAPSRVPRPRCLRNPVVASDRP